jgi:hypothetical protein
VAALVLVPHQEEDGMARPTVCETRWAAVVSSFERKRDELIGRHPDCAEDIALLQKALATISKLLHISSPITGNGPVWQELLSKAEAERAVLCKHLDGKALFLALLRIVTC